MTLKSDSKKICSAMGMRKAFYIIGVCLLVMLVNQTKVDAACVSGFVFDANGNPVNNADLDFYNAVTGVKLVFPVGYNDNTDVLGAYRICVLPGLYHIAYDPPDSTHFIGTRLFNVDLRSLGISTDTILPNIVLKFGVAISGVVTDSAGAAVVDADVDVDSLHGGRVYTPNDKSKIVTGAYWIVVPTGNYRIRFDPPATGGRLRGVQIDSATIVRDTVINVSMMNGMLFSGLVTNSVGAGIRDVDVDLRVDSSGQKVFVSNNSTDSAGFYQIAVPTGVFEVRYTPPAGSRFVAELKDSFVISGDTSWDQVLGEGVICSVFVHDSSGNPVANVDLDLKYASSGVKLFTPNDKSNADGYVVTAVFPDIYEVQIQPPLGSFFDQLVVPAVPINSDTTLNLLLPEVQRINWSGQITNSIGQGLADIKIDLQFRLTGAKAFLPNNLTDPTGLFNIAAPVGTYDVLISPPAGNRYIAQIIENAVFSGDTIWPPITLSSGVLFSALVFDDLGVPLPGADLDFTSETSGNQVFTPFDNTDAQGNAVVSVPPDIYTVKVEPPASRQLFSATITGLFVINDTTVTFLLTGAGVPDDANFILKPNYPNPFNSQTNIQYFLLTDDLVLLDVYNILGQHVKSLKDEFNQVGMYVVPWNGTNDRGVPAASGVYFYRINTKQGNETRRMLLVR